MLRHASWQALTDKDPYHSKPRLIRNSDPPKGAPINAITLFVLNLQFIYNTSFRMSAVSRYYFRDCIK